MEAYYQEAGRAGRDGEKAECILLFSKQDIITAKWMISNSDPNPDLTPAQQQAVRRQDYARLNAMIDYCEETGCLRQYIRTYIGEDAPDHCGDCSSCCGPRYDGAAAKKKPARRRIILPDDNTDVASDRLQPTKLKLPKPGESSLFEQLRACRAQLAKMNRVPPYIICDDKSLTDMARRKPLTPDGLLTVHGMGAVKVSRYGAACLKVIRDYDKTRTTVAVSQQKPQRKAPARTFNAEEKLQLRRAYLNGTPIAQMAREAGCTEAEVRAALTQMGLII